VYLFIFESIGTSELILIGIVALIFLGPRRMPEIARKLGKIMAEFRTTSQEFRTTWEREVNFEAEEKALRLDEIEDEAKPEAPRVNTILEPGTTTDIAAPLIKPIDPEQFEHVRNGEPEHTVEPDEDTAEDPFDKRNWL
jgi:sec-independent protein translocase protein TatB